MVPPIISPMPIRPMVMRLLGAFWPRTVEGTTVGNASAAPATAALLRKSRRLKERRFMSTKNDKTNPSVKLGVRSWFEKW